MEKILVSACLLGDKVRYDGGSQQLVDRSLLKWQSEQRLVKICPEISGGLPVPRAPAEIEALTSRVITQQAVDVTDEFNCGAELALKLCKLHDIRFALLKESSPSCGSSTIYDGTFSGTKIIGAGITAQLLTNNGIKVYSEKNIELLIVEITKLNEL